MFVFEQMLFVFEQIVCLWANLFLICFWANLFLSKMFVFEQIEQMFVSVRMQFHYHVDEGLKHVGPWGHFVRRRPAIRFGNFHIINI